MIATVNTSKVTTIVPVRELTKFIGNVCACSAVKYLYRVIREDEAAFCFG